MLRTTTDASLPAKPETQFQFVDGDVSELQGVRTVFIQTSAGYSVLKNIKKHLKKYNQIKVVENIVDADIVLFFGASYQSLGTYSYSWSDYYGNIHTSTNPRGMTTGEGFAIKIVLPNTIRILWHFKDTRRTLLERKPSSNFARNFIKTHKKVNK